MSDAEQCEDTDRGQDSATLRAAAATLRERVPRHRDGPLGEYTLLATAKLLDTIATALDHGDEVCGEVRTSAVEMARHIHHHPPPEPRESR